MALDAATPAAFPSLYDPTITQTFSKISCMEGAFTAHLVFCDAMFAFGVAAFITRVVPAIRWLHAWMGRLYIICLLWATATSLIIHNTGLPPATLVSFIWVLGGACVAWLVIKVHESRMDRKAALLVQQQLAAGSAEAVLKQGLPAALACARATVAANKTFAQRFLSLKALHGVLMFLSFINVAGRIFASDQRQRFTCHTYAVYKPLDSKDFEGAGKPLTLVPSEDPDFARLPWARTGLVGWSLAMLFGPLVGAALVGAAYSFLAARASASRRARATAPAAAAGGASGGGSGDADGVKLAAVESGMPAVVATTAPAGRAKDALAFAK